MSREAVARHKARNREQQAKREPGAYIAMPRVIGLSDKYWELSSIAMRVLSYLWFHQYYGNNNGDLCATYSQMRRCGFRSRDTIWRALGELESRGWIVRTRYGGRHRCTLWALTQCALDYDARKMPDISPRSFPRGAWQRNGVPPAVSIERQTGPMAVSIPASGPATGPTIGSVTGNSETPLTRSSGTLLVGLATPVRVATGTDDA